MLLAYIGVATTFVVLVFAVCQAYFYLLNNLLKILPCFLLFVQIIGVIFSTTLVCCITYLKLDSYAVY